MAAAQATGLPPKVEPWVPVGQPLHQAPGGDDAAERQPDAMPLANSTTSGLTP